MAICGMFTFGISGLVFMFTYNRMYVKHLIGKGYKDKNVTADLVYLKQSLGLRLPRFEDA